MARLSLLMLLCTAATLAAPPLAAAAQETNTTTPMPSSVTPVIAGGWTPISVTTTESELLQDALKDTSKYRADVTARVCVSEIRAAEQQVVAGYNYRFRVLACAVDSDKDVGKCDASKSTDATACSEYMIRVFVSTGESKPEVVAIKPKGAGTPAPASGGASTPTPMTTTAPTPRPTNSSSSIAGNDSVLTTPTPKDSAAARALSSSVVAFVVVAATLSSVVVA